MFNNVITFKELTRTAAEAAAQIGCELGQIVKSLVFKDRNGEAVLVVTSGSNRVDQERLELFKADANYVRENTGYVIGGVPPWGHKQKLRTLIDEDLGKYEKIYAAAGKNNAIFETSFKEIVLKTKGRVAAISSSK